MFGLKRKPKPVKTVGAMRAGTKAGVSTFLSQLATRTPKQDGVTPASPYYLLGVLVVIAVLWFLLPLI
ncbi:hypothetical protein [Lacticaseibacillus sharpeae]|jgi:hypothetical protein|uniref:hypothetical protein n=1 Tax=Lacticaseibacillus sharpeae TaxID=1626 RepID=UPI0006D23781|nr:hypothetical protein [Lacticaseibacillus sharpeae]